MAVISSIFIDILHFFCYFENLCPFYTPMRLGASRARAAAGHAARVPAHVRLLFGRFQGGVKRAQIPLGQQFGPLLELAVPQLSHPANYLQKFRVLNFDFFCNFFTKKWIKIIFPINNSQKKSFASVIGYLILY